MMLIYHLKETRKRRIEFYKHFVNQLNLNPMWKKIIQYLTKSAPIESEKDVMLDHEYDGIRELDNVLPPWWLWLFYITIFIAVIYMVKYHVMGDWSSGKEYVEEMTVAKADVDAYLKKTGGDINENTAKIVNDAETLKRGKAIFNEPGKCSTCHRPDGGGLIGPNLTDDKWIHGSEIGSLFKVIKNGVPEKGMTKWGGILSAKEIQTVASYILVELKGTNPPNPKVYPGDPK